MSPCVFVLPATTFPRNAAFDNGTEELRNSQRIVFWDGGVPLVASSRENCSHAARTHATNSQIRAIFPRERPYPQGACGQMGSPLSAAGGLFADVNANPSANLTTVTVQPASHFCFVRVEPKGSRVFIDLATKTRYEGLRKWLCHPIGASCLPAMRRSVDRALIGARCADGFVLLTAYRWLRRRHA